MENKNKNEITFLSLDFALNNVGFCIAKASITNNEIDVKPLYMFQEHTKQNYSKGGYANYNIYATTKVCFKLIQEVVKEFKPSFIVSELPNGRRPFSEFLAHFKTYKTEIDNSELDKLYFSVKNNKGNSDGIVSELIRNNDYTSMCLGAVIAQTSILDQICPILTVNYRDAKQSSGFHKCFATKQQMIQKTQELFPYLGFQYDFNGAIDTKENEHACDAVMLAYCLKNVADRNTNAKHFIKSAFEGKNANKNRYDIKFKNMKDMLNKYNCEI